MLSGSLRSASTQHFWHSRRLFQPLLVQELRETFVAPYADLLAARGCDLVSHEMRAMKNENNNHSLVT